MRWFWRWLMIRARGWEVVRTDGKIMLIVHRELPTKYLEHLRDAMVRMTPDEMEKMQP